MDGDEQRHMIQTNKIHQGDSWELVKQLDDESIDCIITSPPYYNLRNYQVEGQAGSENDSQEWIDKMIQLCQLLKPKLKKTGTMFWNIGESYDNKQLLGLPWQFALAMKKNWWLRNAIIWIKPNAMPTSAIDRFKNSYEYIFLFAKSTKYFFDIDSVREPHIWAERDKRSKLRRVEHKCKKDFSEQQYSIGGVGYHPLGKNPGNVWQINTQPHKFLHFAVFPEELAERCILSGCPENGVVLDPFMGSGTTAIVARALKRQYIGFELNPEYIEIANKRLAGLQNWWVLADIKSGVQKTLS
jgi:DNA modification methylase